MKYTRLGCFHKLTLWNGMYYTLFLSRSFCRFYRDDAHKPFLVLW